MARKPRIHYRGAVNHVICRGNKGEEVFKKEDEKEKYIEIMARYQKKYKFKIYAYCLMDNHIHMLLEVDEIPLSKIMQGIQQVYTMFINKRYNQNGHVFQQRYKAVLCDKERYLLALINYIHKNPVKAGLTEDLEYSWSSHKYYVSGQGDGLVEVKKVLEFFSTDNKKAIIGYLKFMNQDENIIDNLKESELIDLENIDFKEEKRNKRKRISVEEIIEQVCRIQEIKKEEINKKNKGRDYVNARRAVVILAAEYSGETNKKIAERLNITEAAVSYLLNDTNSKEKVVVLIEKVLLNI